MVMPFSTCCLDAGEGQKSPQESWVVPKVSTDMLNKSSAVHLGVWNRSQTTNKSCKSIRVDYVYTSFCHLDIWHGTVSLGEFIWYLSWKSKFLKASNSSILVGESDRMILPHSQTYCRIVILQKKIPNMPGKRLE